MAELKNSSASMRGLLKWTLLAVVAISILAVVRNSNSDKLPRSGTSPAPEQTSVSAAAQPSGPSPKAAPSDVKSKPQKKLSRRQAEAEPVSIAAYYFHGYARCMTCRKLEEYSHAAVTEGFPEDTRRGRMAFSAVNVEEPENAHFIQDYRLTNKTLIIQKQRGGKNLEWRNLNRIWELVGDRDAFLTYVQGEIKALRGGGS